MQPRARSRRAVGVQRARQRRASPVRRRARVQRVRGLSPRALVVRELELVVDVAGAFERRARRAFEPRDDAADSKRHRVVLLVARRHSNARAERRRRRLGVLDAGVVHRRRVAAEGLPRAHDLSRVRFRRGVFALGDGAVAQQEPNQRPRPGFSLQRVRLRAQLRRLVRAVHRARRGVSQLVRALPARGFEARRGGARGDLVSIRRRQHVGERVLLPSRVRGVVRLEVARGGGGVRGGGERRGGG
eukprot:29176-Pelagococcus_subviridis.AAC.1